jgi:branched-chain amino acid transport system ATP-binding protein
MAVQNIILSIRDQGITVVVIEHNMGALFRIADRIVVLSVGTKIAEGLPDEVRNNENVISAYLGGDIHE